MSFIKMVENQNDVKVKQIRTNNGTEFRNHKLKSFCDEKGISQNFSSTDTPEQHVVAERNKKTLIEVVRTMLNGLVLSKHFQTKAVRIACYTQNRLIIIKRHDRTPYEIFREIIPDISYYYVFGCLVFIYNHTDHLGKFDAKADDGYFLEYSFVSKSFRVFNTRRQQNKETYHVTFNESMEAIRFTHTSEDEIGIDESFRYPLDEFVHEDDPSRQYQVDCDISYYVIPYVAIMEAIGIFLSFATYINFKFYPMDVKSAFLNSKLKEEVNVKQSPGFKSSEFPYYVYKLEKALYGQKQAPRACSLVKTPMVPPNNLGPDLAGFDLKGYSDSDYDGCNMDRKSTSGACQILGGKLNFLMEFWSTAVAYDPFPLTDETEQRPLKEFLIKFLVLNGHRPLTLDFNTFCSSTSFDYNNDKYVAHPTPEAIKKELGKISINPSHLDKTLVLKNLSRGLENSVHFYDSGSDYTQDENFEFLLDILSNSNFTKDPSKVTDIELKAHMIAVNNQRDSVSPLLLSAKTKKRKSQTCMRTRNFYFPNNSFVTILRRRNKRCTPNIVEPELRTIVAPVADNRIMEELLQAPTKGFEETFGEAWERFKEMLRACPHHGFTELAQIDTFYNGLNDNDQDSLNAATGENILSKTTREALQIIENKSKIRYSINKSNVSRMNMTSRENASKSDDRIDKLADQISTLVNIFAKKVVTPAPVKAVEESCVTCGRAHAYYNCPNTDRRGNKPPADMEPIHPTVVDPSGASAKYQVDQTQSTRLRKVSNALFTRITKDNCEKHEEAAVNYVDLKASIDEYYDENIAHRDQTDKLEEAFMSSLKKVGGGNDTNTANKDPPFHTERETGVNKQEKLEEPKHSTDANIEFIGSSKPHPLITQAQPITIINPEPIILQREGKGIATDEQVKDQRKLAHTDKEEKIKKAEEEARLLAISKPEVIKVVQEEAKKLRIHPKEATTTKAGEKFKKAQDAKHEVLKRQHTEKVRKSLKLRKHKFDNYMWTISKPEHGIFFTDEFGDQAFQRWSDIEKVRMEALVSYLVAASMVQSPKNARFSMKLKKLIAEILIKRSSSQRKSSWKPLDMR
uniref:Retrovirus-related Pol polyprotein from transposon TNT 1-94 n=1 Tax=Tanacetum cinerariifolium TaxID=118510 RepID=A0A6L2KVM5_TANCI|nr:retrovirus-related Pol polyprotein from transposon TNT 1-94 [Tanacetum cinerariifolium]